MTRNMNEAELEMVSGGRLSIAGERSRQFNTIGPDAPSVDDGGMQQHGDSSEDPDRPDSIF